MSKRTSVRGWRRRSSPRALMRTDRIRQPRWGRRADRGRGGSDRALGRYGRVSLFGKQEHVLLCSQKEDTPNMSVDVFGFTCLLIASGLVYFNNKMLSWIINKGSEDRNMRRLEKQVMQYWSEVGKSETSSQTKLFLGTCTVWGLWIWCL